MEYMYRFRSIGSLLNFKELDRQEIFFASPELLNDPIEGFKDVFWDGDPIIWKNLIKHYALCATQALGAMAILRDEPDALKKAFRNIAFYNTPGLQTDREREVHSRICSLIFANKTIAELPELLAGCQPPIRREELALYIRALHPFIIGCVFDGLSEFHVPPPSGFPRNPEAEQKVLRYITDLLQNRKKAYDPRQFAIVRSVSSRTELQRWMLAPEQSANIMAKFFIELPDIYVKSLDTILFSEWSAACFVKNPAQASMWGNYGDGHKGVCLKFKVTPNSAGAPSLKLNRIVGASSGPKGSRLDYGYRDFAFYKVRYSSTPPTVDFFRSIGRLVMPALSRDWLHDETGRPSICRDAMFEREDVWRKDYWDRFQSTVTTKLTDWQHEDEYRLLLYSVLGTYDGPVALKYEFDSLAGIIFGINTSMDDKIAVMKIIAEKCKAAGRTDFQVEQAYYSPETGKIETYPMSPL